MKYAIYARNETNPNLGQRTFDTEQEARELFETMRELPSSVLGIDNMTACELREVHRYHTVLLDTFEPIKEA